MKRGTKRTCNYTEIAAYTQEHPELFQHQVGAHFGVSQATVKRIMAEVLGGGNRHRGGCAGLKRKSHECRHKSDEQFRWEQLLSRLGLRWGAAHSTWFTGNWKADLAGKQAAPPVLPHPW